MNLLIASSTIFYAFGQSDAFGKIIVLGLLAGSIYAWFLMLDKWVYLKRASRGTDAILREISRNGSYLKFLGKTQNFEGPLTHVYDAGAEQVLEICAVSREELRELAGHNLLPRQLSAVESETIRSSLERVVSSSIVDLEDRMGYLATIVSASPFFGLLGTVYGVMASFTGMAESGGANIGAIAPGISGALLTTVVALCVALPSLIGFNILNNTLKQLTVKMDNFVDEFMENITLHKVRRSQRNG